MKSEPPETSAILELLEMMDPILVGLHRQSPRGNCIAIQEMDRLL